MSNQQNDQLLEWLFDKEISEGKEPELAAANAEREFEERG